MDGFDSWVIGSNNSRIPRIKVNFYISILWRDNAISSVTIGINLLFIFDARPPRSTPRSLNWSSCYINRINLVLDFWVTSCYSARRLCLWVGCERLMLVLTSTLGSPLFVCSLSWLAAVDQPVFIHRLVDEPSRRYEPFGITEVSCWIPSYWKRQNSIKIGRRS